MKNNSNKYNLVAENPQSTVVSEYVAESVRIAHYQSEADLEQAFIKQLETQAYEYLPITSEADLVLNLRKQLEKLNDFTFTDSEWGRFFAMNAGAGGRPDLKTTEQAFGEKLHTYTIVNAIADKNVLPFKVDYVSTVKEAENIEDVKIKDIDREAVLASPKRLANIVGYIREPFNQKTKRNSFYKLKDRRLAGFNSIFAVSSIDVAKKYYAEFGAAITKVLPPVSRFSPTGERTQKRDSVLNKLTSFFERFFDISGGKFPEQN